MTAPTGQDVARFLGRPTDYKTLSLADDHLQVVTSFVWAYVRGNGFTEDRVPNEDISSVIITATARLVSNPEQAQRIQVADHSETPAVLNGFTLPELAVLHMYRRRTA